MTVCVAPKSLGARQLSVVHVHGDDGRGAGDGRPGDRRTPDAAAADDRDAVATPDAAGVHRRTEAGHDPAAEQPDRCGVGVGVDLRALAGGDERLLDERADPEGRAQLGAVGQRHLLGGVRGVEAVPGLPLRAGPAAAAYRPPVEDDEVPGLDVGDARTDRLDDAGRLVTEQEREVVVDAAVAVVQVGVADTAGLDCDHGLPRSGIRDDDVDELDRGTLAAGDDARDRLWHGHSPSHVRWHPVLGVGPDFAVVSLSFVPAEWHCHQLVRKSVHTLVDANRTPMNRLLPAVAVTGLVAAVSGFAVSAAAPAAAAGGSHEKPFSGPLPGGYKNLVVIYEENHSFDNLYGDWGRIGSKVVNGLQNATAATTTQVAQDGTAYRCLLQDDVNLTSPAAADILHGPRARRPGQPLRATTGGRSTTTSSPADKTCPAPGVFAPNGVLKGSPGALPAAAPATSCTGSTRSSTRSTAASRTATSPVPTRSA